MTYLILVVVALGVIVALSTISERIGIASPLILMSVGVVISLLPVVQPIPINPEWILMVLLPPLLYAAAISIPTVELRRDLSAVGGLAVILVVISAFILGVVIHALIPTVSLPFAIALGAILSPTDAAATTVIKRLGVPGRVGIILQGEALFNDATSLVLLRSAIAATMTTVSLWQFIGSFARAALIAAIIGVAVGWAGVRLRRLIHSPAPATVLSLLLPFLAYIPSELLEASGLVAAVAAGITAAQLGPKHLDARQRIAERENWRTLEFLLEGAVFLLMGLELYGLVVDLYKTHDTLWLAMGLAAVAIVITLVVRWVFLSILVRHSAARTHRKAEWSRGWGPPQGASPDGLSQADRRRHQELMRRRDALKAHPDQVEDADRAKAIGRWSHLRRRFTRYIADVDYWLRQPLGSKEVILLTWSGMRGVVTLAAAQTLPLWTPHRSLLILIAFFVAAGSLILQGGSLPWTVKALGLAGQDATPADDWTRLQTELDHLASPGAPTQPDAATGPADPSPAPAQPLGELAQLRARREALLELRSTGTYASRTLSTALAELDAEEIRIQLNLSAQNPD